MKAYDYTHKLDISKQKVITMQFVLSYEDVRCMTDAFYKKELFKIFVHGTWYTVTNYVYTLHVIDPHKYHATLDLEYDKEIYETRESDCHR